MVADTTNISIRMDKSLKKEADKLFSEMGMNLSTAFNIFVRQAIREQAFPFNISLGGRPNRDTIEAMIESEKIAKDKSIKGYHNIHEMFSDLESEVNSDD